MKVARKLGSRVQLVVALAAVFALSIAQSAFAAEDYGDLTTGLGAEITAAVGVALAALGTFIAIKMAIKLVRSIVRA